MFLFYGHYFIAFCAVAQLVQTYMVFNISPLMNLALLGFIFFVTLAVYSLHSLVGLSKLKEENLTPRFQQFLSLKTLLFANIIIGLSVASISFIYLSNVIKLFLGIPAILTASYVIPFLANYKLRLRDVSFLKIGILSAAWGYVLVVLPIAESPTVAIVELSFAFLEKCLFIVILALPFDIRDIELDKKMNVKTIPSILGLQKTIHLAYCLLLFWSILVIILYPISVMAGLLVSGIIFMLLLGNVQKNLKNDLFFMLGLDGMLLWQAILVLFSIIFLKN